MSWPTASSTPSSTAWTRPPYGIRWICKQIRSLTKRKYPDANDQVICTLIGGFFFLRFINPAIVTPKSYMLIDGTPAERPRRALTLVAKMLQNLANKPSYAKEPYMAKLQPFIQANKDRINKFMIDLCEVQDFYESLEMDNYVALSKKDLELSITLNEIYAMHGLIEKHNRELCKDGNSHLAIITAELGPAPPQLPRKDNRVINLPLFSRWETAIDDLTAALDITQEEVFFMEAKSVFVQIMRSIPQNAAVARRPLRLERIADAAATSKNDAVMVRKGIRAMELLSQLQRDEGDGQVGRLRPAAGRGRAGAAAPRLAQGRRHRRDPEARRGLQDHPRPQHLPGRPARDVQELPAQRAEPERGHPPEAAEAADPGPLQVHPPAAREGGRHPEEHPTTGELTSTSTSRARCPAPLSSPCITRVSTVHTQTDRLWL